MAKSTEGITSTEALLKNGGKHHDWFAFLNDSTDEFVSFLGFGDLPKFNLKNPEVVAFMIEKAERLVRMGVDAFRIDHALGQPFSFLQSLRQSLQALRSDIVVFGEVWAFGIGPELAGQLDFPGLPLFIILQKHSHAIRIFCFDFLQLTV